MKLKKLKNMNPQNHLSYIKNNSTYPSRKRNLSEKTSKQIRELPDKIISCKGFGGGKASYSETISTNFRHKKQQKQQLTRSANSLHLIGNQLLLSAPVSPVGAQNQKFDFDFSENTIKLPPTLGLPGTIIQPDLIRNNTVDLGKVRQKPLNGLESKSFSLSKQKITRNRAYNETRRHDYSVSNNTCIIRQPEIRRMKTREKQSARSRSKSKSQTRERGKELSLSLVRKISSEMIPKTREISLF